MNQILHYSLTRKEFSCTSLEIIQTNSLVKGAWTFDNRKAKEKKRRREKLFVRFFFWTNQSTKNFETNKSCCLSQVLIVSHRLFLNNLSRSQYNLETCFLGLQLELENHYAHKSRLFRTCMLVLGTVTQNERRNFINLLFNSFSCLFLKLASVTIYKWSQSNNAIFRKYWVKILTNLTTIMHPITHKLNRTMLLLYQIFTIICAYFILPIHSDRVCLTIKGEKDRDLWLCYVGKFVDEENHKNLWWQSMNTEWIFVRDSSIFYFVMRKPTAANFFPTF